MPVMQSRRRRDSALRCHRFLAAGRRALPAAVADREQARWPRRRRTSVLVRHDQRRGLARLSCSRLAAANRYSFQRLILADLAIAFVAAAAGTVPAAAWRPVRRGRAWAPLAAVALVVLGCWRFFPPSEYIIGGKDPGVYVNEGIQIAQRGTLVAQGSGRRVSAAIRARPVLSLVSAPRLLQPALHGFLPREPRDRRDVVGQFPHLFPASIAIGYGLDGLTGARRAVGVWAILGVLAVYFAGRRLVGTASGRRGRRRS